MNSRAARAITTRTECPSSLETPDEFLRTQMLCRNSAADAKGDVRMATSQALFLALVFQPSRLPSRPARCNRTQLKPWFTSSQAILVAFCVR